VSVREYQAEPILHIRHDLGEGIRWDEGRGEIYWVDVFAGRFFRATESGHGLGEPQSAQLTPPLTALSPIEGRPGWVAALCQGIGFVPSPGTIVVVGMPEAASLGAVRMNDGACDPAGRFWAGSMSYRADPGAGSLYCMDLDGRIRLVLGGLTISNGLGWSPDGRTMYHADSGPGTLSRMDFDIDSGTVRNRTIIVDLSPDDGVPDGLCVDVDGCLWVAIWGGTKFGATTPTGGCSRS
jgi:sugar lactone lactonase YvrE